MSVLLPDLFRDEGRVGHHEVKGVVVLLGDEFGVVEVVLEEVGVVMPELGVVLSVSTTTSKRKRGASWLGLGIA